MAASLTSIPGKGEVTMLLIAASSAVSRPHDIEHLSTLRAGYSGDAGGRTSASRYLPYLFAEARYRMHQLLVVGR